MAPHPQPKQQAGFSQQELFVLSEIQPDKCLSLQFSFIHLKKQKKNIPGNIICVIVARIIQCSKHVISVELSFIYLHVSVSVSDILNPTTTNADLCQDAEDTS